LKKNNSSLVSKIKKIKILLSDVDGVLTDGGMYYTVDGLVMKKFNVKDGMGTVLLKKNGFKVGVITSDTSMIAQVRSERLKLDFSYIGVMDKSIALREICEKENCSVKNIAYIGDDVNDLEIMKLVGFSACPKDAVSSVVEVSDYICKAKGGSGCLREIADLIIVNKKKEV
jgi:YrbI family 3-deoxy-D-manno-octulosonate 8-phosphate phosphatase